MKRELPAITALVVLSSFAAAQADEGKPQKTTKPVDVTSLERAKSLASDTTSVFVHYRFELQDADQFTGIMKTLAQNPRIRHLTLRLPNSSHVKDETLDVLRDFQSLETLELLDCRDFQAPSIFDQVAAIKNLKQVNFSFLCRSPSEAACKAALPTMTKLESATFSDGRPHIRQGWEEALNKFASDLITKRKTEQNN